MEFTPHTTTFGELKPGDIYIPAYLNADNLNVTPKIYDGGDDLDCRDKVVVVGKSVTPKSKMVRIDKGMEDWASIDGHYFLKGGGSGLYYGITWDVYLNDSLDCDEVKKETEVVPIDARLLLSIIGFLRDVALEGLDKSQAKSARSYADDLEKESALWEEAL